jgi:hypothetical protein
MRASIRACLCRFVNFTRRHRPDVSLDKELEFHLDMEMGKSLLLGMSPEEAWRRALIAPGGVAQTKDAYREKRTIRLLEATVIDVRSG